MDIWINLQIGCVESCAQRIDTNKLDMHMMMMMWGCRNFGGNFQ
jgi:hypothetical protein